MLRVVVGLALFMASTVPVIAECHGMNVRWCPPYQLGAYAPRMTLPSNQIVAPRVIRPRQIRRSTIQTWRYVGDAIIQPRQDLRRPNPKSRKARARYRKLRHVRPGHLVRGYRVRSLGALALRYTW